VPEYTYKGMLKNGKNVRGLMTAKNRREAIKKLKLSRIQPIRIKIKKNTWRVLFIGARVRVFV